MNTGNFEKDLLKIKSARPIRTLKLADLRADRPLGSAILICSNIHHCFESCPGRKGCAGIPAGGFEKMNYPQNENCSLESISETVIHPIERHLFL
jgi:hypothetical protein